MTIYNSLMMNYTSYMGNIISSGKNSIAGPWLLGTIELEKLGILFESFYEKFHKSFIEDVNEQAKTFNKDNKKDFKNIYNVMLSSKMIEKKVTLFSKDGTRLIDDSLNKILQDSKINTFEPVKLNLYINLDYDYTFLLSIENRANGELEYKIDSKQISLQDEVKFELEKWIDKYKPSKAKQIWNVNAFWIGMLGFSLLGFVFGSIIPVGSSPTAKSFFKKEINEMIKKGINDDNEKKAIEMILKLSSDYVPQHTKNKWKISKVIIYLFSLCISLFIISIFYPKTTLGIGKYKGRLGLYKIYTNIVLVSIPTMIILPILLNKIFP